MSDESNNSSYHDGIFLPFVDEEEEEEDEDNVVMGSGRGRNRRSEDRNDVGRNVDRPGPPNTRFNDVNSDGYFVDGDDRYFKYDENDRWRVRDMDPRRSEPPMQSGGYNVRPLPPQSRGQQPPETDDDYYFLQFGSQLGRDRDRDRDRGRDRYYDDEDDYEGPQPSAPCPAFVDFDKDEKPKGPPSSFGNFVANASMSKTGYAPVDMGEEMSSSTGNMLSPKGLNGGHRDPLRGRSPWQAPKGEPQQILPPVVKARQHSPSGKKSSQHLVLRKNQTTTSISLDLVNVQIQRIFLWVIRLGQRPKERIGISHGLGLSENAVEMSGTESSFEKFQKHKGKEDKDQCHRSSEAKQKVYPCTEIDWIQVSSNPCYKSLSPSSL